MICNLMVRTEYSLMNSLCTLDKVILTASKYGYNSLAMCDFGNLYGAYKFYQKCLANNIKPIIGIEVEVSYNDTHNNILLYAIDNFGYLNLMKIASCFKINKSITLEQLANYQLGILGIIPPVKEVINTKFEFIKLIKNILSFVYVGIDEVMVNDTNYDTLKEKLIELDIKRTAIHETLYIDKNDIDALKVLYAIKQNVTIDKVSFNVNNKEIYSKEKYQDTFRNDIELLHNLNEISNKCNVTIENDKLILPKFQKEVDSFDYLQALCIKGLTKRGLSNQPRYIERLKKELNIIKTMGFQDYFLIVWDYVKYAKQHDILVGPGRGSAMASLVGYSLGITDVDPLKYNLLFERFLNPERKSMPDIDIDFPDDKRDEVIKYVASKYGKMKVAHIITFGTFASKSVLREVSKALNLSTIRFNEVTKLIDKDKDIKSNIAQSKELQEMINTYPDIKKVLEISELLYGLPRNTSIHASGIIVSKEDLTNYTPLENGVNGVYLTQYEASDLESLGLLKMDVRIVHLRNTPEMETSKWSIKYLTVCLNC